MTDAGTRQFIRYLVEGERPRLDRNKASALWPPTSLSPTPQPGNEPLCWPSQAGRRPHAAALSRVKVLPEDTHILQRHQRTSARFRLLPATLDRPFHEREVLIFWSVVEVLRHRRLRKKCGVAHQDADKGICILHGRPPCLASRAAKNLPAMQETQLQSWEGMATHSSILAWRIPRTDCVWPRVTGIHEDACSHEFEKGWKCCAKHPGPPLNERVIFPRTSAALHLKESCMWSACGTKGSSVSDRASVGTRRAGAAAGWTTYPQQP